MTAIAKRVARGAALLDEKLPGWWQRIDLDELDLASSCNCVLGQLWMEKAAAFDESYDLAIDELDLFGSDAKALGFNRAAPYVGWGEYDDLTAAWRELIEARRAAS